MATRSSIWISATAALDGKPQWIRRDTITRLWVHNDTTVLQIGGEKCAFLEPPSHFIEEPDN